MSGQVVIVGGGLAGLTAAAYLARSGVRVILCEKEEKVGGLVNSFEYEGFMFDGGIRAIENSGIVTPMLRQLGIELPFVKNGVSIGIEDQVTSLDGPESLAGYLELLRAKFPGNAEEIAHFGDEIVKIMQYMDILYGIDNPLFLDLAKDREYLMKTILPWMFKFITTINKINKLDRPVGGHLEKMISSRSLIDMIAQHFFKETPTFFALSYFSLYLDYSYPLGGTGRLVDAMRQYIMDHQGEIRCDTRISRIDLDGRRVDVENGEPIEFDKLIWAADLKTLYQVVDQKTIADARVRKAVEARRQELADLSGCDSILTLYLTVDLDKSYFGSKSNPHFFYTPDRAGLSSLDVTCEENAGRRSSDRQACIDYLKRYLQLTTYEISCPVLRDETLAPAGKTGLIISTLFDYSLTSQIAGQGWYEDFKKLAADSIVDTLDKSIYPGLKAKVMDSFVSTPLTIQRLTGNTDGAITGWAFTNKTIPVVHRTTEVAKSVLTPMPDVLQAGQWAYSPSGLPIAIMTGKLAADRAIKMLR